MLPYLFTRRGDLIWLVPREGPPVGAIALGEAEEVTEAMQAFLEAEDFGEAAPGA